MRKTVLFITYILFLCLFTIFSFAFIDPGLIYFKNFFSNFAFSHRELTTGLFIFGISIFFGFYFFFLRLWSKKFLSNKNIIQLIAITAGILLFSYPAMLSFDIFNYIASAKVLFHYHENPYIIMPIEFPGDPLLLFTRAANKIALYGIFWIFLSGIPFLSGFSNFILILYSFKIFMVFIYFGTIFVIWKMTKNFLPVILFALNPLVVIETLVSCHNDIVMVFFMLLAFYILREKKIFLASIFLLLSVLIKYASVFLLPVFFYLLWQIIKQKNIQLNKVFLINSLIFLGVMFFAAPVREEIYPWYAIWFLSFAFLVPRYRLLMYIVVSFSFSLLLRYIPYMLLGTYNGPTPGVKILVTFVPPLIVICYFILCKKNRIPKSIFRSGILPQ